MTSRNAKGHAGEAAYARFREAEGCTVLHLSPSLPSADLLVMDRFGHAELVEVKTWDREIPPGVREAAIRTMLDWRTSLPDMWRKRTSILIVHVVKIKPDPNAAPGSPTHRFEVLWRFP